MLDEYDPLIMYIIFRKDLTSGKNKWNSGALVTNGAHASVAAVIESMGTPETKEYLFSIDDMRKVSLLVESDHDLIQMSEELSKAGLPHKLWIEKPENIPVCIATAVCSVFSFFNSQPNVKSRLFSILGHLKLLR